MPRSRPRTAPALLGALALLVGLDPARALAQAGGVCRGVEVELMPASRDLQIVVWLEDAAGGFVDTLFITRLTGFLGLGNRPGRFDFKSGFQWPYGRRTTTFPIWAHRHGRSYPLVVMSDGNESSIGFHEGVSSPEPFFCRPLFPDEIDAMSCPSRNFSSNKGTVASDDVSLYPPRADVEALTDRDAPEVADYPGMNDLAAIARATPPAGQLARVGYSAPLLAPGDYVVFVEVSREGDFNAAHRYESFPSTMGLEGYGLDYLGQPSVLYAVPFHFSDVGGAGTALDYAGYGAPLGEDGLLRAPDSTITSDVDGSGAGRLLVVQDADGPFRVRVRSRASTDVSPPAAVEALTAGTLEAERALISFVEPPDPERTVSEYEVRYRVAEPITDADFERAIPGPRVAARSPGQRVELELPDLRGETRYNVAVRATDACGNLSPIALLGFTTPRRKFARLEGCVVATAALGSPLHPALGPLRRLRDRAAAASAVAALAARWYREAGPPLARAVAGSRALRLGARALLGPLVGGATRLDAAARAWR